MTSPDEPQAKLKALFEAIAERDGRAVGGWLERSPDLARLACELGATRQDPTSYFFAAITHYAYAGDTALHLAAAAHFADAVDALLARGALVRARNRRGAEPLHYAADGAPGSKAWDPTGQAAVVRSLVAAGADPNAADASGVRPLHRAVRTRCAAAVQALLEHGAEVDGPNKSGSTPLALALANTGRGGTGSAEAREQQARIVELLLAHGATKR